jgi:hypothetical protein
VPFGGWYFLNGTLGPTQGAPSANWGDVANAGYDLSGATALQFWARGKTGGEVVQFFAFGVGRTTPPFQPFPDSSSRAALFPVALTTTWTRYQIPLAGRDIHYVLGGFGWVATAQGQASPSQPITFYLDNIQYVKDRLADPRFLVSYETIRSSNAFDQVERNAAFVYDNAVALIALIAAGDMGRARTIADAMVYAQLNDRFFSDGRLRNAYQGGDIALPPGWTPNNRLNTVRMPGWYDVGRSAWFEDESQVSTTTGNVAWAMLSLLYFYETTQEQKYLQAVGQLGDWVLANTWDDRGAGGFTGGYDGWENGAVSGGGSLCATGVFVNGQCKRLYKATEHNIDLYSAFSRLYLIDHSAKWAQAAQHAKTFFLGMWDNQGGKFWTGTAEDGVTTATDVVPVDIQAWALQALGSEAHNYLRALDYVETNHKTALGFGFKQNDGNSCGNNTWFEGTSQLALTYLLVGNPGKWQSTLNGVQSAQLASGGVPATDGACLNTGFTLNDGQPWLYFPRVHVGATAWLSLAENGVNPFRSSLYSQAPDVTGQVTFTASAVTYNRALGLYSQVINVHNTGGDLSAAAVVLDGLPAGVGLSNADGATSATTPAASPYKEAGQIGSGATVPVTLRFTRSGAQAITYAVRVLGAGPR